MNRKINIQTILGDDALRFASLDGHEAISHLFDFNLTLKSLQNNIDPADILGTSMTLSVELNSGSIRYLNGECVHFMLAGKEGRYYLYQACLKPWLWHAGQRTDFRMFQHMNAEAMIAQVLSIYPFAHRFMLTGSYREWEYCVQYGESDLSFVMRMMEHEGMWFWFEHKNGEHVLIITDELSMCEPFPGYEQIPFYDPDQTKSNEDSIQTWSSGRQARPGQYMAHDYNFTMPRTELPSHSNQTPGHAHDSYEVFAYPGGHTNLDEGEVYARIRMEALQSDHMRGQARANARGFAPGHLFSLTKHPAASQNREYLIIAAHYRWQDNDYEAHNSSGSHEFWVDIQTHDTTHAFRPAQITPKPRSSGPETAVVAGPEGQEIYTDEYGRVKVSFPWNRYCNKDENSSCWIRVSHPWAGAGFGGMHVPRIGQEVLVDYLNGDPDRPVITSRVYNAYQMPPWSLPANATQSGFLTRSSQEGTADNANALRFEDKKGEEQLWIHAERNQDIEVENDETHWVGNDRTKTIDRDETSHIKRDRTETVDRDETITVHGNRKEEVDGNETIDIHKNRTETVDGNEKITIHKNRNKTVDKNETDKIGGNWSTTVNKNKTETITMAYMQNVGLGRMENVGLGYSLNVGMLMNTVVGLSQNTQVLKNKNTSVGDSYSLKVGGGASSAISGISPMNIVASQDSNSSSQDGGANIIMNKDKIELKIGLSSLTLYANGTVQLKGIKGDIQMDKQLQLDSKRIDLN